MERGAVLRAFTTAPSRDQTKVARLGNASGVLRACPSWRGSNISRLTSHPPQPQNTTDPSLHSALVSDLLKKGYFSDPSVQVKAEQGHILEMPSVIHIRAKRSSDGARIQSSIGGTGVVMVRGRIYGWLIRWVGLPLSLGMGLDPGLVISGVWHQ